MELPWLHSNHPASIDARTMEHVLRSEAPLSPEALDVEMANVEGQNCRRALERYLKGDHPCPSLWMVGQYAQSAARYAFNAVPGLSG